MPIIKRCIYFSLCIAIFITFMTMAFARKDVTAEGSEEAVLTVWQIDSFEGGKGSRSGFLQKIGEDFYKQSGCYISVISLTADAARLNLSNGTFPDLISYGAGFYGVESYISGYTSWCHGGYCVLSLGASCDFLDINSENTIINEGKDNFVKAAALTCGLLGAVYEKSTTAYVRLINGDCKYLLGTQRDIYRLKTRGVSFAVKPLTEFNDLYQDISVLKNSKHEKLAGQYIEYLLTRTAEVTKLGLMSDKSGLYDDEMNSMEGLDYQLKLTSPINSETKNKLEKIIADGDINMLKNLLI